MLFISHRSSFYSSVGNRSNWRAMMIGCLRPRTLWVFGPINRDGYLRGPNYFSPPFLAHNNLLTRRGTTSPSTAVAARIRAGEIGRGDQRMGRKRDTLISAQLQAQ